jgi:hypothetical protein
MNRWLKNTANELKMLKVAVPYVKLPTHKKKALFGLM